MTDERIQQLLDLEHAVLEWNAARRRMRSVGDFEYGDKVRAQIKHWQDKLTEYEGEA